MRATRSTLLAALAITALWAPVGCGAAPEPVVGDDQNLTLPQGEQLTKILEKAFAGGTVDVPPGEIAEPALARLDKAVGTANLDQLLKTAGTDFSDDGTQVIRVTQPSGAATLLAFHSYKTSDSFATVGLVNVEDADGRTHTFAESDLVQGTSADGASSTQIASTLFAIDSKGITKVDHLVDDGTTDPALANATVAAFQAGLHLANTPTTATFGNPRLCTACTAIITGIRAAQPVLVFLLAHHFFTAACAAVGVAAGALATPETLGAATVPAAAAGYRGCRVVMAGAGALIALSVLLPDTNDEDGKVAYCNKVASFIPGGHPWCVEHGPSTCSLGKVHAAKGPLAQCMAVGACAHDAKCPAAEGFCSGIYFGDSEAAKVERALCAKIDNVACSGNIQNQSALQSACTDLIAN